jgi:cytochrome d ubiquinol oxidase subunit II
VAAVVLLGFLTWTYLNAHHAHDTGLVPPVVPVLTIAAVAAVGWLLREKMEGWAFVATAVGLVGVVATLFLNLYPRVMVSSISSAYDLTIGNAASAPYTLKVMTVVALIFTPFVLVYQAWSYWVFRQRVRRPAAGAPVGAVDRPTGDGPSDDPGDDPGAVTTVPSATETGGTP